jgi:hypothetical protein
MMMAPDVIVMGRFELAILAPDSIDLDDGSGLP